MRSLLRFLLAIGYGAWFIVVAYSAVIKSEKGFLGALAFFALAANYFGFSGLFSASVWIGVGVLCLVSMVLWSMAIYFYVNMLSSGVPVRYAAGETSSLILSFGELDDDGTDD